MINNIELDIVDIDSLFIGLKIIIILIMVEMG
jgi:hypothetical protein